MNMIKLANIPVGKSIEVFGKKFTILEHTDEGTLVLSDTIACYMPFREKCEARVAQNDFRDSDVCQYLNREYLSQLKNSGENTNAILDMVIDLKCTLGQREYLFFKSKVGLLTLEQYGKYFNIIPKIDRRWWFGTPHGTPLHSPFAYNTHYVWYVDADGDYHRGDYENSYGVRPVLLLDSSYFISFDGVPNGDKALLSAFSDEELMDEVKRRLEMKGG